VNELKREWPTVEITVWDLPEVDITKPETYREKLIQLQPDWVVHSAGRAAVGPSAQDRERYFAVNTQGTERVLETLVEVSSATRVLAISSAEIYGLTEQAQAEEAVAELPLRECRPGNSYAESKLAMEQIIEQKFLDRVIRVRPFPHFGPGQKAGFVTADFAAQIVHIEKSAPREARGRSGVLYVGNLTTKRDFTDVRDVVRAYRLLMEKAAPGEVYNIGSGTAWSIQEIVTKLLKLATVPIRIEQDPARLRVTDVPVLIGDATKLRRLTGWQPKISLEQSLKDILNDWRGKRS
jgi:GDP-4-dehydro-6-deoxy-D-mannose reductase